jgi:DNA-directed RNA polymerase subunit RPC12/RpoP
VSKKVASDRTHKAHDKCPHCGQSLSPWEQVLLSVDRALTCRNCWYKILLDASPNEDRTKEEDNKGPRG